jgi:short-subunit dehydrogenase
MQSAIVTGATSGIGLEIAKMLLAKEVKVYALGRDFSKVAIEDRNLIPIAIDLTDQNAIKNLTIDDKNLAILVNCAGFGRFAPHEELGFDVIADMIALNLTAPLILSKIFLRQLKQNRGFIFNINSISGIKSAPFGAVYGATKAGLAHFGRSLFDEARKSNLKVINIAPDITKTNFFDDLHFCNDDDLMTYIDPKDIAKMIKFVLELDSSTVPTDITLQPQKFRIKKKPNIKSFSQTNS